MSNNQVVRTTASGWPREVAKSKFCEGRECACPVCVEKSLVSLAQKEEFEEKIYEKEVSDLHDFAVRMRDSLDLVSRKIQELESRRGREARRAHLARKKLSEAYREPVRFELSAKYYCSAEDKYFKTHQSLGDGSISLNRGERGHSKCQHCAPSRGRERFPQREERPREHDWSCDCASCEHTYSSDDVDRWVGSTESDYDFWRSYQPNEYTQRRNPPIECMYNVGRRPDPGSNRAIYHDQNDRRNIHNKSRHLVYARDNVSGRRCNTGTITNARFDDRGEYLYDVAYHNGDIEVNVPSRQFRNAVTRTGTDYIALDDTIIKAKWPTSSGQDNFFVSSNRWPSQTKQPIAPRKAAQYHSGSDDEDPFSKPLWLGGEDVSRGWFPDRESRKK